MGDELCEHDLGTLPLPKGWAQNVRHAVLNVIGIVRIATLAGREFLVEEGHVLQARIHRLETEVAVLREELRINGARMRRIAPHRRPQFLLVERMAILELRTMCGRSKAETARRFFVSDATIRAWLRRADDDSLLRTNVPVNRFPDLVRYAVQRIKLFCPTLGKVKIAQTLARAGIHLGPSTVQRILKEKPAVGSAPSASDSHITVPEDQSQFEREVERITEWYNEHRPHDTLNGRTPNEVFFSRPAVNEQPRIEPRPRWPRGSPCAAPHVGVDGKPGDPFVLTIDHLAGRRRMPILRVCRAV